MCRNGYQLDYVGTGNFVVFKSFESINFNQVPLKDAEKFLVNFAVQAGGARTVELFYNLVLKFYDNESFYNSGVLALGAVIGNTCAEDENCDEFGSVQNALELISKSLSTYLSPTYSDKDKPRLLASLRAVSNAGVGNLELLGQLVNAGDAEVSAAAVRSLKKFACDEKRFDILATFLATPKLQLLEPYQFAYVELWRCPTIEVQQLAEWIQARIKTAFS